MKPAKLLICKDEEACNLQSCSQSTVWELIIYDRLQTLRHSTTRNRLAAEIVFVSYGMLLMLSGYKANIESCNLI